MDVVVVNPTVPVGDGDHNATPPTAMLSLFLSGGSPFFLDCVLNLVDVRDLADGILRAGDNGRAGERYILGGDNVAMRELLPVLEEKSGRPMPRRAIPGAVALATGIVAGLIADKVTRTRPIVTREGVADRASLGAVRQQQGEARARLRPAPDRSGLDGSRCGVQARRLDAGLGMELSAF